MDLTLVPVPAQPTRPYNRASRSSTAPRRSRLASRTTRSTWAPATTASTRWHHTLDPRVQGVQLKNRILLKNGMEKQGLMNYENEWWHYTFKPEAYPETISTSLYDRVVARCVGPPISADGSCAGPETTTLRRSRCLGAKSRSTIQR